VNHFCHFFFYLKQYLTTCHFSVNFVTVVTISKVLLCLSHSMRYCFCANRWHSNMIVDSRRALAQKSIVSYAFQHPGRELPPLTVRLKLTNWATDNGSKLFYGLSIRTNIQNIKIPHKILVDFFVEFLTFDGWNSLSGTNNCFYHQLLPAYFMYHSLI